MIYIEHKYFCFLLANFMKNYPCLIALIVQECVNSIRPVWRPIQVIVMKLLLSEDIYFSELVNV